MGNVPIEANEGDMMKKSFLALLFIAAGMTRGVGADDMRANHLGSGLAFFYEGVAHHNCVLEKSDGKILHFSSNEGEFDAPWAALPADVRNRLSVNGVAPITAASRTDTEQASTTGNASPMPAPPMDPSKSVSLKGTVFYVMKDGMLILQAGNKLAFVYKAGIGAKGDEWSSTVYGAGTYNYTDNTGKQQSVPAYANEQEFAAKMSTGNR